MKSRRPCSKCRKTKPIIAFATYRKRDGTPGRRGVCRACRDQYQHDNFDRLQKWRRRYNKKNKGKKKTYDALKREKAKSFVDTFKTGKPCADCGNTFPPVAMDLDHTKGAKFRNVSALVSGAYSIELIDQEIQKCEIVCACCHRVRTAKRKENLAPSLRVLPRNRTAPGKSRKTGKR